MERLAAGLDERGDRAADPGRQSSGSRPGGSEVPAQALAASTGFVDGMGQLNHARGGRWRRSTSDDEGGPGDTQVSVAWLQAEREHGPARALEAMGRGSAVPGPGRGAARHRPGTPLASGTIGGRRIDPGSGVLLPPERRIDRAGAGATVSTKAGSTAGTAPRSSVARLEPELASGSRPGTTVGLSPWDRWLELCTRIDGRPRHLGIHVGGMLVTAVPLVEIAPLERATMPGRVVIQFDKRDVETMKLIKLDLLGLRMLSAMGDALRDVAADCGVVLDLDRLPEDLPDVFRMIRAADTTGVFQIESRAQMQTLPKSVPATLDDLVVEVAIIRPGPIQGNAVHPYLRRRQGIEPVSYLHPSLEPVLRETLGVILYQEQVMEIAIRVAGFSAAESDGFRRAMGTWRSSREMEKLHRRFVDGCQEVSGLADEQAEELFRQVAAFASFGFNKSHAAAFARTAYESAFLKLYYPAQFTAGLINNQPMGFYPVEVLINDAKRHGVAILPVDLNRSRYRTTTEWVGVPSEPLPLGRGIERRPRVVPSSGCVIPDARTRRQLAAESAQGYGIRLGLHLVKGIGEEHAEALDGELERGPYRSLADVVARTGLAEEMIERLIRAGALDSLGRPRRELLWQLREVVASTGREGRDDRRIEPRVLDLRLPPTDAPDLTPPTEVERLADSYAILSLDARRQVIELFRPVLDQLGVTPNARLSDLSPGRVRIAGLVVTRQHPMTARGTVFLALEDETAMANVTLWPDQWNRFRSVVRRHALLLVDGALQREASVVNVVAHEVRAMSDVVRAAGGPEIAERRPPSGLLGHAARLSSASALRFRSPGIATLGALTRLGGLPAACLRPAEEVPVPKREPAEDRAGQDELDGLPGAIQEALRHAHCVQRSEHAEQAQGEHSEQHRRRDAQDRAEQVGAPGSQEADREEQQRRLQERELDIQRRDAASATDLALGKHHCHADGNQEQPVREEDQGLRARHRWDRPEIGAQVRPVHLPDCPAGALHQRRCGCSRSWRDRGRGVGLRRLLCLRRAVTPSSLGALGPLCAGQRSTPLLCGWSLTRGRRLLRALGSSGATVLGRLRAWYAEAGGERRWNRGVESDALHGATAGPRKVEPQIAGPLRRNPSRIERSSRAPCSRSPSVDSRWKLVRGFHTCVATVGTALRARDRARVAGASDEFIELSHAWCVPADPARRGIACVTPLGAWSARSARSKCWFA